ncbi:hypothetical protein B0A58_07415 [Flavobacterium branchiophilum NBRC 15030 = ATCC 35035]|uniref:Uncharacterized protein n=1 Tax=Flavobacterium branchiophilum TaxID=55197 RepID=A0A543G182_9FLAO|nr:hypothetical protein [Flavobacterium branchiophilum]OXA76392.1 hypothetical protein B0A58_07415 [Flavobacterium branchiophilum NBRC 15030 = ATCC 35035]TQM39784.1 hypothetical protein BC670_0615 [Flavobacterium branchiophilum]GEM55246.1 hypothetical protein FB1_14670 [Flavobacterium branchiophilum NBRC 15030 = ATCC 35035]
MLDPIFEANPSLDCYYKTTDGTCFFTDYTAASHANTLIDNKVSTVHRQKDTSKIEQAALINVEVKDLEPIVPIVPATPTEPVVVPKGAAPEVVIKEAKPNTKK